MTFPEALLRQWYLHGRSGPFISLEKSTAEGTAKLITRGLFDVNTERGAVRFVPPNTLERDGSFVCTMMMGVGSYPLEGGFPITFRLEGQTLKMRDAAGSSATLTALSPIPRVIDLIAKPNVSAFNDVAHRPMTAFDFTSGVEEEVDFRHGDDCENGAAETVLFRGSGTVLGTNTNSGWVPARVNVQDSSIQFGTGHRLTYSIETRDIPPGWGSTSIDVLLLSGQQQGKIMIFHRDFRAALSSKGHLPSSSSA
ncbi:hypothetical protein HK102_002054 [Quaeritorhiza haematococci]|nr:hypothetical protein HK102_002054 [Quaeritorhiza haematococci]